jgi:hypothetical protein
MIGINNIRFWGSFLVLGKDRISGIEINKPQGRFDAFYLF